MSQGGHRLPTISPGMQRIPVAWFRGVEAWLKAITPLQGVGIRLSRSTDGTTFYATPGRGGRRGGGSIGHPFEIYRFDAGSPTNPDDPAHWRNFRVGYGTVNGCPPTGTDGDSAPFNILVPAQTNGYKIWIRSDVNTTNGQITGGTLQHGAAGWPSYPDQPAGTPPDPPSEVFIMVGQISTGPDSARTASIFQALTSNLWGGIVIFEDICDGENNRNIKRRVHIGRA